MKTLKSTYILTILFLAIPILMLANDEIREIPKSEFNEMIPERQQMILNHPDQFKVVDDTKSHAHAQRANNRGNSDASSEIIYITNEMYQQLSPERKAFIKKHSDRFKFEKDFVPNQNLAEPTEREQLTDEELKLRSQ